jgi:hypothetical protein
MLHDLGAAYNTLDATAFATWLDEDSVWESQSVMSAMTGKTTIMEYLEGKAATLRSAPDWQRPLAVLASINGQACLAIYQGPVFVGDRHVPVALFMVKSDDDTLKRVDVCILPPPETATLSTEYPGLTADEAAARLARIASPPALS